MLVIVSPAKKLNPHCQPVEPQNTPIFTHETQQLVCLMQKKSVAYIQKLMDLSGDLAQLNYNRFQQWQGENHHHYPAVLLFHGDTYLGLKPHEWDEKTKQYAMGHLVILSGLYGALAPFDPIQPYRLEMGVALKDKKFDNLYQFWGDKITHYLAQKTKIIVNCASGEYNAVIDKKTFQWVNIDFKNAKNGQFTAPGMFIKRLRGACARLILEQQLQTPEQIKNFVIDGYEYNPQLSSDNNLVFVK